MKAKKIQESISFERGGNPKKSLNIGLERKIDLFRQQRFGIGELSHSENVFRFLYYICRHREWNVDEIKAFIYRPEYSNIIFSDQKSQARMYDINIGFFGISETYWLDLMSLIVERKVDNTEILNVFLERARFYKESVKDLRHDYKETLLDHMLKKSTIDS